MDTPTYEVNGKAESTWSTVQAAAFSVVSLGLIELGVSTELAIAVGTLVGSTIRPIVGHFLPEPKS